VPTPPDTQAPHRRRRRYVGKNPRAFHDKYKELDRERYAADAEKILAAGKTLAGTHRPIMVQEVLRVLAPRPGESLIDCTLGGGGHTEALLARLLPGGRVIGLDLDRLELPKTEARLRAAGFDEQVFIARQGNFAALPAVLAAEGLATVDLMIADLGTSSMQVDNPDRGFSYKEAGPLDMRLDPSRAETAAQLLARLTQDELARVLTEYADEPYADLIASAVKRQSITTTQALGQSVRTALEAARPARSKPDVKMSVRRTFQALRIAVNDELSGLDALLRHIPQCLAPGGRVAILTFHSGEDRRVKKAFQAGHRSGVFSEIAGEVVRSTIEETRANRRASSAKLRWAVRAAS
jgi:16S rRNA (cytosine1402-N4)-methyltransferase